MPPKNLQFVSFNVGKGSTSTDAEEDTTLTGGDSTSRGNVPDRHEGEVHDIKGDTSHLPRYKTLKAILGKFLDVDLFFIQEIEQAKYVCRILNELHITNKAKSFAQFGTEIAGKGDTRIIYNQIKFKCTNVPEDQQVAIFTRLKINRNRASLCELTIQGSKNPFIAISWHDHWKVPEPKRFSKTLFQNIAGIVNSSVGPKPKFVVGGDFNKKIIFNSHTHPPEPREAGEQLVTEVFAYSEADVVASIGEDKANIRIPKQICHRQFNRDFFVHNHVSGKRLNLKDAEEVPLNDSEKSFFDHFPVKVVAAFP